MVRTYILMQFVFMMKTTNTCIPHIQYSLTYLTASLCRAVLVLLIVQ